MRLTRRIVSYVNNFDVVYNDIPPHEPRLQASPSPIPKIRIWSIKQIDVSFSCVCPIIDNEFRYKIVKIAVVTRDYSPVDPQTTFTMI